MLMELAEAFMTLCAQRTQRDGDDHVVWVFPAVLFSDVIAEHLRGFGVIRPDMHIYEGPLERVRDFRAEAVHFVIIAVDPDDDGIISSGPDHLTGFEIGADKNESPEMPDGTKGRDGPGKISCGGAGDRGES